MATPNRNKTGVHFNSSVDSFFCFILKVFSHCDYCTSLVVFFPNDNKDLFLFESQSSVFYF